MTVHLSERNYTLLVLVENKNATSSPFLGIYIFKWGKFRIYLGKNGSKITMLGTESRNRKRHRYQSFYVFWRELSEDIIIA